MGALLENIAMLKENVETFIESVETFKETGVMFQENVGTLIEFNSSFMDQQVSIPIVVLPRLWVRAVLLGYL